MVQLWGAYCFSEIKKKRKNKWDIQSGLEAD